MRITVRLSMLLIAGWSSTAIAGESQPLRIGFGTNKPPYVFENEKRGLEYDIVVESARRAGFEVQAVFAPLERLRHMFAAHEVDAITTTGPQSSDVACYTAPYIEYHNVAMALASHHFDIRTIDDLGRYSVSSFQRSRELLGDEYRRMAEANSHYREEANQVTRNLLLFSGRIDVIVGDTRILAYFNRSVASQVDVTQPITTYELFQPVLYSVAFADSGRCAAFDRGLAELRKSGGYARIEQSYRDY